MNPERPGDSSNDSDEVLRGPHSAEPPPTQHSDEAESGISSGHRGFTVQPGGRSAMADTAERLGRAAATAGRGMRRSLELVRPAGINQDEAAALFGELSEFSAEPMQRLREQLQDGVARSRRAARRLVSEHPVRTLAALAGFCFALGVGLRVSGSRRR